MIRELKGPSLINIIEKIAKLPQVTSNPPSDKDSIYNIYTIYIYTPICMYSTHVHSWMLTRRFFTGKLRLSKGNHLRVGLRLYTYIHIHTHTHTHTYTYIHIHTHTYTYIHIHTHTYNTYIHITYIHIHTHTYTYIHIHTHTYTHTHICIVYIYKQCTAHKRLNT